MKNQKAAIEVQMNWIFVMIIGGVILFFFIGIVAKQRSFSEQKLVSELIQDIDQYISGASVAPRGAATLPVPGYDITLSCDFLEVEDQRSLLESRVLFAPEYVADEDRQLIVWTLPWSVPYEVTNFVYATGPGVRYVFTYEDQKYDYFFDNFITDKINKIKAPITQPGRTLDFADEGNYLIKVVMLGRMEPVQLPEFARNSRTSFVYVPDFDPREKLPSGKVYFLQYDPNTEEFETYEHMYLGVPSLMGAIFSDSVEEYDCAMQKGFKNMHAVNSVYAKKIELLGASQVCPAFYGEYDQNLFAQIAELTESTEEWDENLEELRTVIGSLGQRNNLIQSQSCPLIY